VVYGVTAGAIEALLVAMRRHALARSELHAEELPVVAVPLHRRRGAGAVLYSVGIVVGLLLLPRLAAVLYLLVAARAVFVPGAEGRLTLHGPS
jgi:hypothetical protein